jgi:DNA-binding transcriptional LysR family regulator
MDLGQGHLKTIIAVAECGSIGRAAIRLGQSQPAVSSTVRRIEQYLGGELFHRSVHGVRTTPLGDLVLVKAKTLAAGLDRLTESARDAASAGQARLRIAGQPCPAMIALTPTLADVLPEADVEVRVEHAANHLLDQLVAGQLDVCLLVEPVGFEFSVPVEIDQRTVVAYEPCFVGMSDGHPLADKEIIDLAELTDEDWIDNPLTGGNFSALVRFACQQAGFEPRVRYWVSDPVVASPIVRSGRAMGLFAGTAAAREGVVFRPLKGDPVASRLVLFWRETTAAETVWNATKQAYHRVAAASPHLARWQSNR